MNGETVEQVMKRERERISKEKDKLSKQRSDIEDKISALDQELSAIEAYETVKSGKPKKAPRGSKRAAILEFIAKSDGVSRAEIIDGLNFRGNKSAEGSLSNTLTALKKQGKVKQGEDGKYTSV